MTLKDIGLAGATLRQVDSSHRDTERETDRVKNQSNYKRAEGWSSGRIKRRADHRKIWHWRETLDTFRRVFLFCGQFPIYDIPSTVPQGSVEKLNKENWKSVTRIFQSMWKTKVLNLKISPFFFHVSYNHKKYIILAYLRYFLVFIISFCRTFKSGWSVITIYERNDTLHKFHCSVQSSNLTLVMLKHSRLKQLYFTRRGELYLFATIRTLFLYYLAIFHNQRCNWKFAKNKLINVHVQDIPHLVGTLAAI